MATPARTITSALTAGSRPITRPWSSKRRKERFARIGHEADSGDREREPGAEGDDQQQAERHAVQGDRGQQDDERGGAREQSTRDADGRQSTPAELCGRVLVPVVMVMPVGVGAPVPHAGKQNRGADADHEQAGGEADPGIELLRHDELGEGERHEAECEDAHRVGRRHDQAERRRMPGRSALADEIGGDDRLSVAGRERVRCAPEEGDPE